MPPPGRPGWKYAYEDVLWSKHKLPLKLRGLLQVLLRLSDHLGRVWWSQSAIAEQAGCTVRTLRRLLPALEASGFARVEAMTFRQLALAQAALGLPLPGRSDDGQAPDLITLLVHGKPAVDLRPVARRRPAATERFSTPAPGQSVQGSPRTNVSVDLPRKAFDPADKSSADPWDLSADLFSNGGDPKGPTHPSDVEFRKDKPDVVTNEVTPKPTANDPTDEQAWLELHAAYDRHFRRVYHARPTSKPVSAESREQMAGHLADMAKLLHARFVERNVDLASLDKTPLELLADETLRAWFDSSGANDYLRRVSHRMSALPADLPYRARKATEALLERHAPKPAPRRIVAPVLPFVRDVSAPIAKPPSMPWSPPPSKPPIAKTNLPADVKQILEGLSQHCSLRDLAETSSLANELVMVMRERGASIELLLRALDVAAEACQGLETSRAAVRAGIVYKRVLDVFDDRLAQSSSA